jgi:hypothetical protein
MASVPTTMEMPAVMGVPVAPMEGETEAVGRAQVKGPCLVLVIE